MFGRVVLELAIVFAEDYHQTTALRTVIDIR